MKLTNVYEARYYKRDYKHQQFSLDELIVLFEPFIDTLVDDHGNDRDGVIDYHLKQLVGLPYFQLIRKMPRGPRGRERWAIMLHNIKYAIRGAAKKKATN